MTIDTSYTGQFIEYVPLHSASEVYKFLEQSYYTNFRNFKGYVDKLCAYESTRNAPRKIYAITLRAMIPATLTKSQKHEFANKFMLSISPKYKTIPFAYRPVVYGNGHYILFLVFERTVYNTTIIQPKKYKRDMYINKSNGRIATKDDPDAILRCKKNSVIFDTKGQIVYAEYKVSPKKIRAFAYHDDNDREKKAKKFIGFVDRLKEHIITTLSKIIVVVPFYKLKCKRYSKKFSKSKQIKILNYNQRINLINLRLIQMQELFYIRKVIPDRDVSYQKFMRLFHSLVAITKEEQFKIKKDSRYKISISITRHHNFKTFINNLDAFVEVSEHKIRNWHYETFRDILIYYAN